MTIVGGNGRFFNGIGIQGCVFEEGRGLVGFKVGFHWSRRAVLLPILLLFGLFPFLGLPIALGCQGRLDYDGWVLFQVLATGRLGCHDGLGAVHYRKELAVQLTSGLLPALHRCQLLLLNVPL